MRAMSLVSSEADGEQNEMRCLQEKLENTISLVALLSGQLAELKEQVQRSHGHMVTWSHGQRLLDRVGLCTLAAASSVDPTLLQI